MNVSSKIELCSIEILKENELTCFIDRAITNLKILKELKN